MKIAKLVERGRKYVTEDGQLMIIKETGEIKGVNVKGCWVLRDSRGFYQDQNYDLDKLAAKHDITLEK